MESVLARLEELLKQDDFVVIRNDIRPIIQDFRKIVRRHHFELRQEFVKGGGNEEEFVAPKLPEEVRFDEMMNTYGEKKEAWQQQRAEIAARRAEERKRREEENARRLEQKRELLKGLIEVVEKGEQSNETFQQVRELQKKWNDLGKTFGDEATKLQSQYSHQIDIFFYNKKISNQLRDMEHDRNLTAKLALLEQIEQLRALESVEKMASLMRKYQAEWNEIGPVTWEKRDEVFERFRTAADDIYGKIKGFYEGRREEQRENLKTKIDLCEQVQALLPPEEGNVSIKSWQEKTDKILSIQETWKGIGFSEENEKIWQVFRNLCDKFFNAKRHFFDNLDTQRVENKAKKEEFCQKAEEVQDSTDWRKTTDYLIKLQKDWKNTGPAPRDVENKLWERFRTACDAFFNAKKAFFANIGEVEAENLVQKEALIAEINAFEPSENVSGDFQKLKEFSTRWSGLGYVPLADKDRIYKAYNTALDAKYDALKVNREERMNMRFKNRIENLSQADNAKQLINREQNIVQEKIERLQNDIMQYQNNLGFFKSSNKSNPLKKNIEDKINKLRREVADLKNQLRMLRSASNKPKVETPVTSTEEASTETNGNVETTAEGNDNTTAEPTTAETATVNEENAVE